MNTGVVDVVNRTYDLGLYQETDSSLLVNTNQISWSHRKETGEIVKYHKSIPNPTIGERGDYLVASPCLEVREPFSVSGYYPLYMTTHNANAAGGGTGAHEHELNGKTYHMPNGGTIFHGNYTPTDTYEELGGYMSVSKQNTKTKPCIGKLLADTTDLSKFTTKTFFDRNGAQRTAVLVPVSL